MMRAAQRADSFLLQLLQLNYSCRFKKEWGGGEGTLECAL